MEFNYYFQNSLVESGALRTFWEYPATTSGDFSGNNPAVGSFPADQVISKTLAIGSTDFTIFLTFESGYLASPTYYQYRAQKFINSIDSNNDGWSIGLAPDNSLFIHALDGIKYEALSFDRISLASKNCIAVKRSGNYFTVYVYDLMSKIISQEQTIFFSDNINIGRNSVKIGHDENSSDFSNYMYTFSWFGQIEQLAAISEPLGRDDIEYLFQGFEYKTITATTTYSNSLIDESWSPSYYSIPSGYRQIFDNLSTSFLAHAESSYGNESIRVNFSGNFILSGLVGSGSGGYTSDSCSTTGSVDLFTYSSMSGVQSGMITSGWILQDNILFNSYRAGYSGNYRTERLISHNFSLINSGQSLFRASYNALYYATNPSTSYDVVYNDTELGSYFFDGAYVDKPNGGVFLLASNSGGPPTGINMLGNYNNISGLFSVVSQSGFYYYNGLKASPSGVLKSGDYIDLISYGEVSSDSLVYDMYNNVTLLNLTSNGTASGRFYPGTATPYTGENSYSVMYRVLPSDFVQTSKLSLVHSQPILNVDYYNEFNNLEDFWQ